MTAFVIVCTGGFPQQRREEVPICGMFPVPTADHRRSKEGVPLTVNSITREFPLIKKKKKFFITISRLAECAGPVCTGLQQRQAFLQ